MARIFEVKIECECGMKNPTVIGKPNYFKPIAKKHTCPDCKSEMIVIIQKNTVTGPGVDITRKMTKISDDLRLMQMEVEQEAKENA